MACIPCDKKPPFIGLRWFSRIQECPVAQRILFAPRRLELGEIQLLYLEGRGAGPSIWLGCTGVAFMRCRGRQLLSQFESVSFGCGELSPYSPQNKHESGHMGSSSQGVSSTLHVFFPLGMGAQFLPCLDSSWRSWAEPLPQWISALWDRSCRRSCQATKGTEALGGEAFGGFFFSWGEQITQRERERESHSLASQLTSR